MRKKKSLELGGNSGFKKREKRNAPSQQEKDMLQTSKKGNPAKQGKKKGKKKGGGAIRAATRGEKICPRRKAFRRGAGQKGEENGRRNAECGGVDVDRVPT